MPSIAAPRWVSGPGGDRVLDLVVVAGYRHDDLVRGERRERIADGEGDVRFAGARIDRLAGKLLGQPVCDLDGVRERTLVVREPVEHALADNRDDDLDDVVLVQLGAERAPELLDRADDEDVATGRRSTSSACVSALIATSARRARRATTIATMRSRKMNLRQRQAAGDGEDEQDQDDEPQHWVGPFGFWGSRCSERRL